MSEPFIGMIILVGFNFAPRGYATCSGQIMGIAQNTALFSLLGTTYGGNGQTTFALPDLRGRVPMGEGQGPGLPPHVWGELAGVESTSVLTQNLPAHVHPIDASALAAQANARNASGNSRTPVGAVPAVEAAGVTATYSSDGGATEPMAAGAVTLTGKPTATGISGNNQPISIMQPYLTMVYCIALEGIFPSRN